MEQFKTLEQSCCFGQAIPRLYGMQNPAAGQSSDWNKSGPQHHTLFL